MQPKRFISHSVVALCTDISALMKIILTYKYSKGDVLSAEKNNKLEAHCNKLITYISFL